MIFCYFTSMSHPETPHTVVDSLNADHFRSDATYKNWRSRGTPDWLLIFTVRGSGRVGTSQPHFSTQPGDVILFEPRTPQSYDTDPGTGHWEILWSHFYPKPHWTPWLHWAAREKGLLLARLEDRDARRNVRQALLDCVKFNRQHFAGAQDFAFNALERAILWIHQSTQSGALDERIRRATEILAEEISQPLSVPELARRCGLSLSRFAHLFREEMGISPQQYLEQVRLSRAAQLLRSTGLGIAEIAEASGYANAFYFSNRFRKTFRRSPTAYRAEKTGPA